MRELNPNEYEIVIKLNEYDDEIPFKFIEKYDYESALLYLKEWHYPGEHETTDKISTGQGDKTYKDNEGYTMVYNTGLGRAILYFKPIIEKTKYENSLNGKTYEDMLNGYNDDDTFDEDEEIIFSYTRKEALADGMQILVDAKLSKEAGIIYPVFITASIRELIEKALKSHSYMSYDGILWDIFTMFVYAVKAKKDDGDIIKFQVKIGRKNQIIYAQVGAYDIDNPQPAITIMLEEDM